MDHTTQISLTYIGISFLFAYFLFAYFWGRKRQIGFWWSFFLMLGFLPGWMVMLNDHLTETDPKPEKSNGKIIVGIILMMLSTYLLYLLLKDSAEKAFNEYLILTLTLSWFFGLGYYFFQRGSGVAFNHKPQKTTNTNTEAGAVGNTTSEPKIQTSHQSNTVPSLILKPLNNSGVNQKYESQSNQQTVSKTELPSKPLPLTSVVVGYNLELEENSGCYPVLRIPKKGSTIRSYREGKTRRRGFKEEEFQKSITQYFGNHFLISGQARINTGGRPYEPDIAMVERKGINNIMFDIEIDEPYVGITRMPTHCNGEDYPRDTYFVDSGWVVIRFSEYQVHNKEKECLKFIAKIINNIESKYVFSSSLTNVSELSQEPFWDILQAQKWEQKKHRENYLGHEFWEISEINNEVDGELNLQELHEESQIMRINIVDLDNKTTTSYNYTNRVKRDDRIKFYPDRHVYIVDGVPFSSVSSIIDRYFPVFDSEYWAQRRAAHYRMTPEALIKYWDENGKNAAKKGTILHQQIESYFLEKESETTEEFHLFKQFLQDHNMLTPYRTEWRIFDEQYSIAGTIDLLARNRNDFEMYDWKRSEKVVNKEGEPITTNQYPSGLGRFSDIPDTKFNRYCMQQSMYRYIIEKRYNINVLNMFLVILHPHYKQYYKVNVPYWKNRVEYILNSI